MDINPGMAALLGLVVWLLGLAYKYVEWRPGWEPDSKRMIGVIAGVSVLLGIGQCVFEARFTPLPAPPADTAQMVFAWIPQVLAWVAATVGMVFAVSQGIYKAVRVAVLKKP